MSNKFLDELEKLEKEATGGGGIICNFNIATGYKVFLSGTSNTDSFFPFEPGNEDAKAKALASAKALCAEKDASKHPQLAVQILARKTTVKGREVAWREDRHFVTPVWQDSYKKVVKPALAKLDLGAGDYWGKITFTADPSGRKRTGLDGKEQDELVAFPVEVYKNEAEAASAAGQESAGANGNGSAPPNWEEPTWQKVIPDLRKMQASGKSLVEIAGAYAVPVEYVSKALATS